VPLVCIPASGSLFPLGTTVVSCLAVDGLGFTNQRSFSITVRDTTPPLLERPANFTTNADASQCFASHVVLPTPGVSDVSPVTITNNAPTQFSFGVTPVIWTAIDASGNISVCTQSVIVAA